LQKKREDIRIKDQTEVDANFWHPLLNFFPPPPETSSKQTILLLNIYSLQICKYFYDLWVIPATLQLILQRFVFYDPGTRIVTNSLNVMCWYLVM